MRAGNLGVASYTKQPYSKPNRSVNIDSRYSCLYKPIMNDYSSFETCLEQVYNGEYSAQPFCRHFCVTDMMSIIYKDKGVVGTVDVSKNDVILNDDFFWLEEALQEAIK